MEKIKLLKAIGLKFEFDDLLEKIEVEDNPIKNKNVMLFGCW